MKLEDQIVSLELAKKLKELGVKQESVFYWQVYYDGEDNPVLEYKPKSTSGWETDLGDAEHPENLRYFSAFTVAELLQLLKEPVLVPVDGSAADYLADLIIKQHEDGKK